MNKKELEDYMLEQLPETLNKSEGTVVRDVISAMAAGMVKMQEMDEKNFTEKMYKSFKNMSMRGNIYE